MGNTLTTNDVSHLLDQPLAELVAQADRVRQTFIGDRLELCSIHNAKSGRCSEDCKFCAQSTHHQSEVDVYTLCDRDTLIRAGQEAKNNGAGRFGIVTSGNRLTDAEVTTIAAAVTELVERVGITVCASLGALPHEHLAELRDAGLARYHHNIETSRRYYREIVTTHDFEQRINTIRTAQELGLQVCSGGIIGMGETPHDRLDMALTLRDLNVDSIPINILMPIPGTPFAHLPRITVEEVVRTIAVFRILLEHRTVKIAAGREVTLGKAQINGFRAGANGMIIGGYLTIKGDALAADQALVNEVRRVWKQSQPS